MPMSIQSPVSPNVPNSEVCQQVSLELIQHFALKFFISKDFDGFTWHSLCSHHHCTGVPWKAHKHLNCILFQIWNKSRSREVVVPWPCDLHLSLLFPLSLSKLPNIWQIISKCLTSLKYVLLSTKYITLSVSNPKWASQFRYVIYILSQCIYLIILDVSGLLILSSELLSTIPYIIFVDIYCSYLLYYSLVEQKPT